MNGSLHLESPTGPIYGMLPSTGQESRKDTLNELKMYQIETGDMQLVGQALDLTDRHSYKV